MYRTTASIVAVMGCIVLTVGTAHSDDLNINITIDGDLFKSKEEQAADAEYYRSVADAAKRQSLIWSDPSRLGKAFCAFPLISPLVSSVKRSEQQPR